MTCTLGGAQSLPPAADHPCLGLEEVQGEPALASVRESIPGVSRPPPEATR